jgi:hypothetical protein
MILHQCLLIIVCTGGEPEYLALVCHHSRVPERSILEELGILFLLTDWLRHLFHCLLVMVKEEEQDFSEDRLVSLEVGPENEDLRGRDLQ